MFSSKTFKQSDGLRGKADIIDASRKRLNNMDSTAASSNLASNANDLKNSMKELAAEIETTEKSVNKNYIILSVIIVLIVLIVIIVVATIMIRNKSKSSYSTHHAIPCGKGKKCAKNLNDVFSLNHDKEGYTGISDANVLSDGTLSGGVISSTGITTLPSGELQNAVIQNHYKSNPFNRFKSGINEAQIGENLVLAHKIYNGINEGLTNDQLRDDDFKLAKGSAAQVQGLYKRIGGIKTVYEPTKAQGIADVKNVAGRQNLVNFRDTRYAIPIATFDVDTQRLGYLDKFSTNYSGASVPSVNSSVDIFGSMKSKPTQYDSSRMILTSQPQESGVTPTPMIAPNMSANPISNKIVENYRNYTVI